MPRQQEILDLPLLDSLLFVTSSELMSVFSSSRIGKSSDTSSHRVSGLISVPETFLIAKQIVLTLPPSPSHIILHLGPILPSLWRIWECLLLGESVLILGPSPDVASGLVWWIRELLRPVSSAFNLLLPLRTT